MDNITLNVEGQNDRVVHIESQQTINDVYVTNPPKPKIEIEVQNSGGVEVIDVQESQPLRGRHDISYHNKRKNARHGRDHGRDRGHKRHSSRRHSDRSSRHHHRHRDSDSKHHRRDKHHDRHHDRHRDDLSNASMDIHTFDAHHKEPVDLLRNEDDQSLKLGMIANTEKLDMASFTQDGSDVGNLRDLPSVPRQESANPMPDGHGLDDDDLDIPMENMSKFSDRHYDLDDRNDRPSARHSDRFSDRFPKLSERDSRGSRHSHDSRSRISEYSHKSNDTRDTRDSRRSEYSRDSRRSERDSRRSYTRRSNDDDKLSPQEKTKLKTKMLRKLNRLRRKDGMGEMIPRLTMQDSYEKIKDVFSEVMHDITIDSGIKFSKDMLTPAVSFLEWMNNRWNPFDLELEDWSEQVYLSMEDGDYDEVLEELVERYSEKVEVGPEMRLLMMLGGSAYMYHFSRSQQKQLNKQPQPGIYPQPHNVPPHQIPQYPRPPIPQSMQNPMGMRQPYPMGNPMNGQMQMNGQQMSPMQNPQMMQQPTGMSMQAPPVPISTQQPMNLPNIPTGMAGNPADMRAEMPAPMIRNNFINNILNPQAGGSEAPSESDSDFSDVETTKRAPVRKTATKTTGRRIIRLDN